MKDIDIYILCRLPVTGTVTENIFTNVKDYKYLNGRYYLDVYTDTQTGSTP